MEFIDLKAQYKALKNEIDSSIGEVLQDTRFIGGPQVARFEKELGEYIGRKYCISCANGTEALQLAFMAYGVGPGDAVFCPDMTFISSVEPAVMLGATPVFCDIESDTFNLSPSSLEEHIKAVIAEGKLTPKFVVAVDFLGNPARLDEISAICRKYGLILIEDAAQASGAAYKGKKCGSFGDIATTSFFPSKPLGCYGDGGAIYTDDDEIAALLASLKVHGKGPNGKYDNVRIGLNCRLDTVQAAVLLCKLRVLDAECAKRQEVAARYDAALSGKVQIPVITPGAVSSYAQYCVLAESTSQREAVLAAMKKAEVPSLIYYPNPLHMLKAFAPYPEEKLENTAHYAQCNFGLPFSPYLTEADQDKVISTVLSAL